MFSACDIIELFSVVFFVVRAVLAVLKIEFAVLYMKNLRECGQWKVLQ